MDDSTQSEVEALRAEIEREKEQKRAYNRESAARYRANSPNKAKAKQDRYREKHRDKILEYGAMYRERIGTAVATQRTIVSQHKKRVRLAGRPPDACAGCGATDGLVFDHCHTSNKFRGWLCPGCNKVLGFAKDSSLVLRNLADYVDAFNLLETRPAMDAAIVSDTLSEVSGDDQRLGLVDPLQSVAD